MHKLAKGLKKKKKQKKGKKGEDDEEFDAEELERYRRERAETQQKLADNSETSGNQSTKTAGTGNDEWKKFQALTSGIDSVLKKTQNDLDRIKSTSFFQRKAPEPEPNPEEDPEVQAKKRELAKRYVGFDKDGNPIEENSDDEKENNKGKPFAVNEDGLVEVPDDEEEPENSVEEDIFDTTYVDVLQNIDVQLAYIPDSPTEEQFGDDPFDTTNADKVLKTVDKTGKKLVSLGNAVEVLSGRVDYISTCKVGRNRPRPKNQDLLGDFDDDALILPDNLEQAINEPVEIEKTLLDDDCDFPDIPIDLTKLPPGLTRPVTPVNNEEESDEHKPLDIYEFELLKEKTVLDEIPVLDDEEFNLDASVEAAVLEETEDPFAEKEPKKVDLQEEIIEVSFEVATFANEEDPFDTTIADNILPGKTELKFIEKELEEFPESEVSISLTDPSGLHRDYETGLLKVHEQSIINTPKKDLLGGSFTDLNQLIDKPIEPVEEISYVDPFDTSGIQDLPPCSTELKVLEKELLGDSKNNLDSLEDDDFDPRKEEKPSPQKKKPPRPPAIVNTINSETQHEVLGYEVQENIERKSSDVDTFDSTAKIVAFEIPASSKKPDLLAWSEEEKSLPNKPLTPYYSQKSLDESLQSDETLEVSDVDPFDTSFVLNTAPGKTELKLIESELLQDEQVSSISHSLSDHDFDPRSEQATLIHNHHQSETITGKPIIIKSSEVIESLINKRKTLEKRQDSILDTDVDVSAVLLAPNVKPNTIEEEVELTYKDPFDTSHATNILPGKAELKLLENELSQIPDPVPVRPHPVIELANKKVVVEEDPDFDPRAAEITEKDILCFDTSEALNDKILTPIQNSNSFAENIDPFDTSFANIDPGKTELRLLESELINK
jgi:hypothetical protein